MAGKREVKVIFLGDSKNLARAMSDAERQTGRTGKALSDVADRQQDWGKRTVVAGTIGVAALVKFGTAASDLSETVSKSDKVFGDNSDEIRDWAAGAADDFGQSQRAALDAAAGFGGLADMIGKTDSEGADFAMTLTELGSDMASFGNTRPEDAVLALGSALRGESEPIRAYNVILNESMVKQEAYASGIAATGSELTEAQKVQARYNLILKQTATLQGDYDDTADGLANTQRRLNAEWENAQASLGQAVLPAMTGVASGAADLFGVLGDLSPETQKLAGGLLGASSAALLAGGSIVFVAGKAKEARTKLTELGDDGKRSLTLLGKAAAGVGTAVAAWQLIDFGWDAVGGAAPDVERLAKALDEAAKNGAIMGTLQEDFGDDWTEIADRLGEFVSTAEDLDNASGWMRKAAQAGALLGDAFDGRGATEFRRWQKDFDAFDEQLAEMVNSGHAEAAMKLFGNILNNMDPSLWSDFQSQMDDYSGAIEDWATTTGSAKKESDSLSTAERARIIVNREAARAQRDHNQAMHEGVAAAQRLIDQELAQNDAGRAWIESQLRATEAAEGYTAAQQALNDAIATYGAGSPEATAAGRDFTRAMLEQSSAEDGTKSALLDHVAAMTKYDVQGENSTKATQRFIDELGNQRETIAPGSPLRAFLDSYIADLLGIPVDKVTKMSLPEIQQRIDELGKTKEGVDDIPGSKSTNVTVTGGALDVAIRIREAINEIQNRDVYVNIIERNYQQGGVTRRADGGPVRRGELYLVGEEGPELAVFGDNGTIIPNDKLPTALDPVPVGGGGGRSKGGGAAPIHVHLHVHGDLVHESQLDRLLGDVLTRSGRSGGAAATAVKRISVGRS